MIHVCYTFRDTSGKYSKYVGTSIQSLLDNTREEVTIHLIHDDSLSLENRKKLMVIVYQHNQEIVFYNLENFAPDKIKTIQQQLPTSRRFCDEIAAFYRTMIPELIDLERVIYLDSDTIVNLDINELWQIDLENKPIAGVSEVDMGFALDNAQKVFPPCQMNLVDPKDYINSGVLIFNLDAMKSIFEGDIQLFHRCLNIILKYPQCSYPDQDALNIIFTRNLFKLPPEFNKIIAHLIDESHVERAIYHFCGTSKKPHPNFKSKIQRLWFEYFLKTPFANLDSLGNMWGLFEQIFNGLYQNANFKINLIQRICKFSVNRKRIFITYPQNANRIVELFGLGDGDVVLNAASQSAMNNLIRDAQNDRRIFIFLVDDRFYSTARNKLIELKFIECEDFFDCRPMFMQLPTFHEFIDPISKNF